MSKTKLNMKKAQEEISDDYGYGWRLQQFPKEYDSSFVEAVPTNIEGYDFGGAEHPYHPGLTIVDVGRPSDYGYALLEDNPIEGDIGTPLSLEPRSFINVSHVINQAGWVDMSDKEYDKMVLQIANNIDKTLLPNGKVRLADSVPVLRPVLDYLNNLGYKKMWGRITTKNTGTWDENDNEVPAQEIILQKPSISKRVKL